MARVFCVLLLFIITNSVNGKIINKRKCPEVRAVPHFDLTQLDSDILDILDEDPTVPKVVVKEVDTTCPASCQTNAYYNFWIYRNCLTSRPPWWLPYDGIDNMLGDWYVVEYYASEEEALSYSCMRAVFTQDDHVQYENGTVELTPGVTMNFTYRFADDPIGENLLGNITWRVDLNEPAHWTHSEMTYDGIYNTYVLDTEYKTWSLLLHCAEQREGARYLSAFVLSRKTALPKNVMAYLRDKLPRYDVDINYVFPIKHDDCTDKTAKSDYTPILLEVNSTIPRKPGVAYNVAFGH